MAQGTVQARRPQAVTPRINESKETVAIAHVLADPLPVLLAGMVLLMVAKIGLAFQGPNATILVILSLITVGAGVAMRPLSPVVLGIAAISAFGAWGIIPQTEWDSLKLLALVLFGVATVGTILVLLPVGLRKLAVSFLLIFHILAILSAATSVSPTPWLCSFFRTRVFRPYLEMTYLTNAYHFYSPEPGPATQLRFYITYNDGSGRWYTIPRREDYPLTIEYQRRLSITEYTTNMVPPQSPPPEVIERRLLAGALDEIPHHALLPDSLQYRIPTTYTRLMLESYARRVARMFPHPSDPTQTVVSVKIYRMLHSYLEPKETGEGKDPLAKDRFLPFFMGEFDPQGQLIDPNDPYLYWVIPSVRLRRPDDPDPDPDTLEFVEKHAHLAPGKHLKDMPDFRRSAPRPKNETEKKHEGV
jgi:hypothetical protein